LLILNLSRGNNGLRVPLRLPATPADIGSAYVKLDQISEEIAETRIAGVVTEVGFLDRFFRGKTIEDYSDLNELAKRVNSMTEQELHTYDGALNAESINDVSDLLRIADSLNRYIFINGITTEKELGQFLVDSGYKAFPESVKPYLDYAAIGAEYYAERGGAFTAEGYTLYRSRAESLSPEENEWWKPIFRVLLQTTEQWDQEQEPYVLVLPATTEQLFAARSWLDVADIDKLLTEGNTVAALDELYIWLSSRMTIEYIRNTLKRVRKKESSLIMASQNLEDFNVDGVRELTRPLFAIPTHQFIFHCGAVDKQFYMQNLQLEESEYELIRYPQNGVCLYKCGVERFLLEVHAPEYKQALFGAAGGR
jgi:hypothetical protein